MIEGTIARNGEILRRLYFIRKEILVGGMQVVNDEIHNEGIFLADDLLREINQAITLIERGLPEWAKEMVKKTFEFRRGVIIWEPIKKEV